MHVFGGGGFKGQVIHAAPAVVGLIVKPRLDGNRARPHRRNNVQHSRFHVVLHIKLDGIRFGVNRHSLVLRAVFDHPLVLLGPDLFEQTGLGRDIRVGIKDQHL